MCDFVNLDFWQTLVTTFIGAGLAIPAAFYVDRRIKSSQQVAEKEQLKGALIAALESNSGLLDSVSARMKRNPSDYSPPDPLDLILLDSTAHKKYELLGSIQDCQSVDQARFQLSRIDARLALIRQLLAEASRSGQVRHEIAAISRTCLSEMPEVSESLQNAIRQLQASSKTKKP